MSHQFQKVKLSDIPLSETIVRNFSWWFRKLFLYECHQDLEKSVSSLCDLKRQIAAISCQPSSLKLTSLPILIAPVSLLVFLPENILPNFLQQYWLKINYFSPFLIKSFCFKWEEALIKWPDLSGSCIYGAARLKRKIVPSGPDSSVRGPVAISFRKASHLLPLAWAHACLPSRYQPYSCICLVSARWCSCNSGAPKCPAC